MNKMTTKGTVGKNGHIGPHGIFISHSWKDKGFATTVAQELEHLHCGKVWIDYEGIGGGEILDKSIRLALRRISFLIVLWSENAAASQWVAKEIRIASVMGHRIVPCVLDDTPLEKNRRLAGRLYCDFRTSFDGGLSELVGHLYSDLPIALEHDWNRKKRAESYRELFAKHESGGLEGRLAEVGTTQSKIIDAMEGNIEQAMAMQTRLDRDIQHLLRLCPEHPDVLGLAGDHLKNDYQLKRWKLWQQLAGDYSEAKALEQNGELLKRAEVYFFRALSVEPLNPGALNGIGSIYYLRGNLQMSEHWKLRAQQIVRKLGEHYDYAFEDVEGMREAHRPGYMSRGDLLTQVPALSPKGVSVELSYVGSSRHLPQRVKRIVRSALLESGDFCQSLGFAPHPKRQLVVEINPDLDERNLAYDPEHSRIRLPPWSALDSRVLSSQYIQFVLSALWEAGGHGWRQAPTGLLGDLADYFCRSLYDPPDECDSRIRTGEATAAGRSRSRSRAVAERRQPASGKTLTWGKVFWDIRKCFGNAKTDKLLFSVWTAVCRRKRMGNLVAVFIKTLHRTTRELHDVDHSSRVAQILQESLGLPQRD